jgi:hypothetical protein
MDTLDGEAGLDTLACHMVLMDMLPQLLELMHMDYPMVLLDLPQL